MSIKLGSPLAIANNNPGNLRYAGQEGAIPGNGGFAKFNTPDDGYNALKNQVSLDASGGHTLSSFITKYAPPTENDTQSYIKQASDSLGVDSNTPLQNINTDKIAKFLAMKESSTSVNRKYEVKFDTGQTVVFDSQPTKQDIEEVANKLSIGKKNNNKEGFLTSVFRGITSPIATMIARPFQAGAELLGYTPEQVNKASAKIPFYGQGGRLNVPQTGQDIIKDIGRGVQTVALGMPAGTLKGAIGMGALAGAGSSLERKGTTEGLVGNTLLGAGLGAGGYGVSKLLEAIPKALTGSAFRDMPSEQINKMLAEKTIGTKEGLLRQSQEAVANYGKQIEDILSNTQSEGAGNFSLRAVNTQYPEYSIEKIVDKIKKAVPAGSNEFDNQMWSRSDILPLVDKIANGTATLQEKNLVRKSLDYAIPDKYFENIGTAAAGSNKWSPIKLFADSLRAEVQQSEPATIPIFKEFTKEMGIKSALTNMVNKPSKGLIRYSDLVPFIAGNAVLPGAGGFAGVATERALQSPSIMFGGAKIVKGISGGLSPLLGRAGLLPLVLKKK